MKIDVYDRCSVCNFFTNTIEYINGVPYCLIHARRTKDEPVTMQYSKNAEEFLSWLRETIATDGTPIPDNTND